MDAIAALREASQALKETHALLEKGKITPGHLQAPSWDLHVAEGGAGFGFRVRKGTADENGLFRGHDAAATLALGASATGKTPGTREAVQALNEAEALVDGHGLSDRRDELRSLRARHAGLLTGVRSARRELENKYDGASRAAEVSSRQKEALDALERELKGQEGVVESLSRDLAVARDDVDELERVLRGLKEDLEDSADLETRVATVRARRDQLREEAEALHDAVERAERKLRDVEEIHREEGGGGGGGGEMEEGGGGEKEEGETAEDEDDKLVEEEKRLSVELAALRAEVDRSGRDEAAAAEVARERGARAAQRELADAEAAAAEAKKAVDALESRQAWLAARTSAVIDAAADGGSQPALALRLLREKGGQVPMSDLRTEVAVEHIYRLLGSRFVKIDRSQGTSTVTALVL